MYIMGQERRLVNPPSQVVAGVRTVTTNMDGRDVLPRLSRPFAFLITPSTSNQFPITRKLSETLKRLHVARVPKLP